MERENQSALEREADKSSASSRKKPGSRIVYSTRRGFVYSVLVRAKRLLRGQAVEPAEPAEHAEYTEPSKEKEY